MRGDALRPSSNPQYPIVASTLEANGVHVRTLFFHGKRRSPKTAVQLCVDYNYVAETFGTRVFWEIEKKFAEKMLQKTSFLIRHVLLKLFPR